MEDIVSSMAIEHRIRLTSKETRAILSDLKPKTKLKIALIRRLKTGKRGKARKVSPRFK